MLNNNMFGAIVALLSLLATVIAGSRELHRGGFRIEMRIEQTQPRGDQASLAPRS